MTTHSAGVWVYNCDAQVQVEIHSKFCAHIFTLQANLSRNVCLRPPTVLTYLKTIFVKLVEQLNVNLIHF